MWNFLVRNRDEIIQEHEQPVRLTVFGTVFRYGPQNGFGMVAQHCKFKQVSRVEKNIGVFLIRVYPFYFRTAHVRPVGNGFFRAISAFLIISYNSA